MTKEQEKARARRQREKFEAREVARAAEQKRNKQVVGVVIAVLAVIAIFIGVSTQLGDDDGTDTATPGTSQTADPGATEDPGATGDPSAPATGSVEGCEPPPAAPTDAQELTLPDKATAEGKTYTATLTTNCGDIVLELDGAKAPQTVASFVYLAGEKYFDDSRCHRITGGGFFVLQCGDRTAKADGSPTDGTGGPGYTFGLENDPDDNQYPAGTLAMARQGNNGDSNGSQFFIVYDDTEIPSDSAGGYSVFGKVTEGLDLVKRIGEAGVAGGGSDGAPAQPLSILSVDVTEKS